jgi:hypothetical protein
LLLDKFAGHRGVDVAAAEFSTVNSLFRLWRVRVRVFVGIAIPNAAMCRRMQKKILP